MYSPADQRKSTAAYIKSLEQKVCVLEELLTAQTAHNAASDSRMGAAVSEALYVNHSAQTVPLSTRPPNPTECQALDEDMIETMVNTGEAYVISSRPLERFRGRFAGLSLLQRVQSLCRH